MKRFPLSEKFKKKATAPLPTEIERPQAEKEPVLRKWLLRGVLIILLVGVIYFVFRDIFFVKVKGLVKPEKITVQANTDGVFIALASVGETVEPNRVVGKIYNPAIEAEIKALNESIKLLTAWREKLKSENLTRKELTEFNLQLTKASQSLKFSSPETIRKKLESLYEERASLIESITQLSEKLRRIKELIQVGAATELDFESVESKLIRLQSDLSAINSKISDLEERLKKAEEFQKIEKKISRNLEINPLLPDIVSIDSKIDSIKSRIHVLESEVSSEFISFPFKVKIASILPSGTRVIKGTQVLTALNVQRYYVVAYVPPDRGKGIYVGENVKVILPNGVKLKGTVEGFEPTLVLKPAVLVGPLEKRSLVLPVRIRLLGKEKEVRKIVYENMPVTVVFNK